VGDKDYFAPSIKLIQTMKKLILGALALFFGFALRAQTITIVNLTDCFDVAIYGGIVKVDGSNCDFGSASTFLTPGSTTTYSISGSLNPLLLNYYLSCCWLTPGPGSGTNIAFDGVKFALYDAGTFVGGSYVGVGYLNATMAGCPANPNPVLVEWGGLADNPTVVFKQ
jgi:hypothetical protein